MNGNYDDEQVTLSDGAICVDGVMVSSSRSFTRDPRLAHPTANMERAAYWRSVWTPEASRIPDGYKYCSSPLKHAAPFEDAILPIEMFGSDRTRRDGKGYVCRECRNKLDRMRYAGGRGGVRTYRRRELA